MFNLLLSKLKQNPNSQNGKQVPVLLLLAGLLIFGIMAFMSWMLFKERMLNFDPSFFSFLMLQEEWFSPVLTRYGTVLSQLLPLMLIKSGVDLDVVLKYYSLSFVLLYILYLLIIGVFLKDKKGIVAICIALTLTFRETFFYSTAELYQAIGLSVLLWSLFSQSLDQFGYKRTAGLVLSALLIVGISFFHQLGIFTTFFVLSVEYIRRARWKDIGAVSLMVWSVVWFLVNIKLLTTSTYEQERLLSFETFFQHIGRLKELGSFQYFASFFKGHLVIPSIISGIGLLYLLLKRRWILAGYITIFSVAFCLIVIVALHHEGSPIMLQNYFTVLGLFAGVLFAIVLEKRSMLINALFIVVVGLYSLKEIYQVRYDYQARTEFVQEICEYGQQFPEKKYVMHAQHLPWEFVWVNWALPFETLLSSEINSSQETVTYYSTFEMDTMDTYDVGRPDVFLGPSFAPHWFTSPSLNEDYFSVSDGQYRVLNSQQSEENLSDSVWQLPEIEIQPQQSTLGKTGGWSRIKLDFYNHTNSVIASIPGDEFGLWLYYRTFDENEKSGVMHRRQMLFDLVPEKTFTQTLVYEHPPAPSWLEIGFFSERDSTFYPKARIDFIEGE